MQHLEKKNTLSAGPAFLGEVGIMATTHERADFNSRR
jgi:hypothetical protein